MMKIKSLILLVFVSSLFGTFHVTCDISKNKKKKNSDLIGNI